MTIFEKPVVSGLDDVEQRGAAGTAAGTMSLASGDLELVNDGTTGIDIPQGAIITSAYLQFQTDEVGSGAWLLNLLR